MASQILHNETKYNHQETSTRHKNKKRCKKTNTNLKNSFWSLLVVTIIPLSLRIAIIYFFGSGKKYIALTKPIWFPSLPIIHMFSVVSTLLTSLAAWLVWTNGEFRLDSDALPLYIAQVSLSIVWEPLVLRIGAVWLGIVFCLVHFGTLVACHWMFGKTNSFSKLLIKPCLVWAGYLTLVTFRLTYLYDGDVLTSLLS